MGQKRRRGRTGCLTCRARRIKCDEQRPECRRCMAANVECAGYEQKRVVVPVKPPRSRNRASSTPTACTPDQGRDTRTIRHESNEPTRASVSSTEPQQPLPAPSVQLPLVALPCNPRLTQRPSLGARHVLGYQQVLLRTLHILFPSEHLSFWRDELLQEAWGCDYLYLTFVALGNMHRVALMANSNDDKEKASSLDLKITAVQIYTEALRELSVGIEEAKRTPVLLVSTLCLMAYFESFSGNIPACIGRVQSAEHYFTTLLDLTGSRTCGGQPQTQSFQALHKCIISLSRVCRLTVPLSCILAPQRTPANRSRRKSRTHKSLKSQAATAVTAAQALQSLCDLIYADKDFGDLIWSPIAAHTQCYTIEAIDHFRSQLRDWRSEHQHLIPELDTDSSLDALLVYKWQRFSFPPPVYTNMTRLTSLAAAHYNFYEARMKWAMLLISNDQEDDRLAAEFYFYEALRHATSHTPQLTAFDGSDNAYIPCEALNAGLLALLHQIGLCSPQPTWVEWIIGLCEKIVQEGVLKGLAFAKHLDCLHRLEVSLHSNGQTTMEQYPPPKERTITVLIPEADGRHLTAFFASPKHGDKPRREGLSAYKVIASARWKCNHGETPLTPEITMYDPDVAALNHFSMEWLNITRQGQEWLAWGRQREFSMDCALQDHISGTRLLLAGTDSAVHT